MAEDKASKRSWIERQRDKRRAKAERTGDTREKKGDRPDSTYNPQDVANRVTRGGVGGGGIL